MRQLARNYCGCRETILLLCLSATLSANVITDWNTAALNAIRQSNTSPPAASRHLAILHIAIYDAVNGIRRTHEPYFVTGAVAPNASIEAAAAAAAHKVLVELYPALGATFNSLYSASLNAVPNGAAKQNGIAWGEFAASTILQLRSNDGSANNVPYTPGTNPDPGEWRPTISFGGVVRPALLPGWGSVKPFALATGSQFRPPRPPKLNSLRYAFDVNQVKELGPATGSTRTREQTEIALFWGYGPATATPPGHWNQIVQAVALQEGNSVEEDARLFALVNIALVDAGIVSWDCKYVFNLWRPITAIQEADTDGNPFTAAEAGWTPLLPTPPFPEYTSGHSTFSAAAAAVLTAFYKARNDRRGDVRFSVGSDDLPGVFRYYDSFADAAIESGMSRIYGGIHFLSANVWGLATGALVGNHVVEQRLVPLGR